ncbi:MAG TPA: acyl-CoA thioesterase domain-containing protein, partial [Acidimicrobiales bacterium]|nr:acyl-CoA thioesterase domain-containing protein [Acidimicrobiales bacterium]
MPLTVADDLNALFDLERLDADLFRGVNEKTASARPALFGGQVAGQALRAAALTVPDGRMPHSLHGYFLRPGRWQHPVILKVDRDRDGKSFSARHVSAVQEGQVIFSALASFHIAESGPEFAPALPEQADPDGMPEERALLSMFAPAFTIRPFPPVRPYGPDEYPLPARLWAKSTV